MDERIKLHGKKLLGLSIAHLIVNSLIVIVSIIGLIVCLFFAPLHIVSPGVFAFFGGLIAIFGLTMSKVMVDKKKKSDLCLFIYFGMNIIIVIILFLFAVSTLIIGLMLFAGGINIASFFFGFPMIVDSLFGIIITLFLSVPCMILTYMTIMLKEDTTKSNGNIQVAQQNQVVDINNNQVTQVPIIDNNQVHQNIDDNYNVKTDSVY